MLTQQELQILINQVNQAFGDLTKRVEDLETSLSELKKKADVKRGRPTKDAA